MSRKSIDVKFIIPEDMDIEDLVWIIHDGANDVIITSTDDPSRKFQVELEEALIRDRLIILKEMK